jgi:hypothetical protein
VKTLAIAALAIAGLALTACEVRQPGAPQASGPPAGCARALAAARPVSVIARHFAGVATRGDVIAADMAVAADTSISGTEASDLAGIAAARAGASSALAAALGRLGADYTALEADTTANAAPASIAQDAQAIAADSGQIGSGCS